MDKGTAMSYTILVSICNYLNMPIDTLLRCNTAPTPTPAPPDLNTAVSVVAAAAHISPDALRAVLHLPINDK